MGQTWYTIGMHKKLRDDIMLLKIKTDARSAEEVIRNAIRLLKKHLRQEQT